MSRGTSDVRMYGMYGTRIRVMPCRDIDGGIWIRIDSMRTSFSRVQADGRLVPDIRHGGIFSTLLKLSVSTRTELGSYRIRKLSAKRCLFGRWIHLSRTPPVAASTVHACAGAGSWLRSRSAGPPAPLPVRGFGDAFIRYRSLATPSAHTRAIVWSLTVPMPSRKTTRAPPVEEQTYEHNL
ncbi:hypothetical protein EVAR_86861_1 [Eumeta japonica]|uniref:Uncharacterized protein n=1 Tax=Eumeta variegata TaxID=151549 RepID=A0A4C1VT63_EUMVA|nr:hypothetical protein EVAR_86861_1 [Eumeta japonica]